MNLVDAKKIFRFITLGSLALSAMAVLRAEQILITAPTENEVVSSLSLNGNAAVSIQLDFFAKESPVCELDGVDMGVPTQVPLTQNFNYMFDPLTLASGPHVAQCHAMEPNGTIVTSEIRHFTIDNSGNSWSTEIKITAPQSGDVVTGMVALEAVSDPDMPTSVEFYLDNFTQPNFMGTAQWIGTGKTLGFRLMKNLNQFPVGPHMLLVRATYPTNRQEKNFILITIGAPQGASIQIKSPVAGAVVAERSIVTVNINTIPTGPVSCSVTEAVSGRTFDLGNSMIDPVTGYTYFTWESQYYLNGPTQLECSVPTASGVVSDKADLDVEIPQNYNYFHSDPLVMFDKPSPDTNPVDVENGQYTLRGHLDPSASIHLIQFYARLAPNEPPTLLGQTYPSNGKFELTYNMATLPVGSWKQVILLASGGLVDYNGNPQYSRVQARLVPAKVTLPNLVILNPVADEHVKDRYVVNVQVSTPIVSGSLHCAVTEALSSRVIDLGPSGLNQQTNNPYFTFESQFFLNGDSSIQCTAEASAGGAMSSDVVHFVNEIPQNFNYFHSDPLLLFDKPSPDTNPVDVEKGLYTLSGHLDPSASINPLQFYARFAPNEPPTLLGQTYAINGHFELTYNMATLPVGSWQQLILLASGGLVDYNGTPQYSRLQVRLVPAKVTLPNLEILNPVADEHVKDRYVVNVQVNTPIVSGSLHCAVTEALSSRVIDLGPSGLNQQTNNPYFTFDSQYFLNGDSSIQCTAQAVAGGALSSDVVHFVNEIPQNFNYFHSDPLLLFDKPSPDTNPVDVEKGLYTLSGHLDPSVSISSIQFYARFAPNEPPMPLGQAYSTNGHFELTYNLATLPVGSWKQVILLASGGLVDYNGNLQYSRLQARLVPAKVTLPNLEILNPVADEHVKDRYVVNVQVNTPIVSGSLHCAVTEALSSRVIDLGPSGLNQQTNNPYFTFDSQFFLNGDSSIQCTAQAAAGGALSSDVVHFVNEIPQNFNYFHSDPLVLFDKPSPDTNPVDVENGPYTLRGHQDPSASINSLQFYARLAPNQPPTLLGQAYSTNGHFELTYNLATLPVGSWKQVILLASGGLVDYNGNLQYSRLQVRLVPAKVTLPNLVILNPVTDEHVKDRYVVNVQVNTPIVGGSLHCAVTEALSSRVIDLGPSGLNPQTNNPYFTFDSQYFLNGDSSIQCTAQAAAGGALSSDVVHFVNEIPQNFNYFHSDPLVMFDKPSPDTNPVDVENGPYTLRGHLDPSASIHLIQFYARLAPNQPPTLLGQTYPLNGQFELTYNLATLPVGSWQQVILLASGGLVDYNGNPQYSRIQARLGTPKNPPPPIVILSPVEAATVSNIVPVRVQINFPNQNAACMIDGIPIGPLSFMSPDYALTWNSASVSNGAHSLTCSAMNLSGAISTSDPVHLNVQNAQPERPLTIVTPTNNSVLSNRVLISAAATPTSSIIKVVWKLDTSFVLNVVGQSPFNAIWNTPRTPNGKHRLAAYGYNGAGALVGSDAIDVYVLNANTPGALSLRSAKTGSDSTLTIGQVVYEVFSAGEQFGFGPYTEGSNSFTVPTLLVGSVNLGSSANELDPSLAKVVLPVDLNTRTFPALPKVKITKLFDVSGLLEKTSLIFNIPSGTGAQNSVKTSETAAVGKIYFLNGNGAWVELASVSSEGAQAVLVSQAGIYAFGIQTDAPDEFAAGEIYVFPNPAVRKSPTLHAEFGSPDTIEINIFDESGAKIRTIDTSAGPVFIKGKLAYELLIERDGLASGIYYAVVTAKKSGYQSVLKRIRFAIVR